MDRFLIGLLLTIERAENAGGDYCYVRERSDNPREEVAGLKELEEQGLVTCGSFLEDSTGPGGYYVASGPCHLTYAGQDILKQLRAKGAIETIQSTQAELPSIYAQALDHLEQASKQLRGLDTDIARKDSVRDCLSAMESLVKTVTGKDNIRDAIRVLRVHSGHDDSLMADGISIWDRIHKLYPDVRHGQAISSTMSREAALYWVDRIMAYIRYVARTQRES